MNILYINHYAGSDQHGMEFRPFYLAKEWTEMGMNPVIVAAEYSHLRTTNPEVSFSFQEECVNGVPYCWVKTVTYKGNSLGRIASMIQFVSKLCVGSGLLVSRYKPDVVICSSTYPLDTYAGQLISKQANAKLIHEVHDLWPLTPMKLGGYSKHHPWIQGMAKAERSAYEKSDCIVSILPNIDEHVRGLGVSTKIVHVPNGVPIHQVRSTMKNEEIRTRVLMAQQEGQFVVGYAGGLAISNAMIDLVKAAELLRDRKIVFVVIGEGTQKHDLVEYARSRDLANVYFYNPIPRSEVHDTLSLMNALYIGSRKSDLYEYGMSANKIFDYMLTGKPIIDALDTNHSPLSYSRISFKAEAENPMSIAECIKTVSDLTAEQLDTIYTRSRGYVMQNHSYALLAKRFAEVF